MNVQNIVQQQVQHSDMQGYLWWSDFAFLSIVSFWRAREEIKQVMSHENWADEKFSFLAEKNLSVSQTSRDLYIFLKLRLLAPYRHLCLKSKTAGYFTHLYVGFIYSCSFG